MRNPPAIFLAVALTGLAFALPAAPADAGPREPTWFTQSEKLYGIAVPFGSEVQETAPNAAVIRSQNGTLLRIQTAPGSKQALTEMAAKLESVYLGPSKTWTAKLAQEEATVGGLPALTTIYEGSKLRSKALIVRGAKTDFVFIYSAPLESYNDRIPELDWMLQNFRPSAAETMAAGSIKAPVPASRAAALPTLPQEVHHFSEEDIGYSVAFPGDWTATRVSPAAVLLGGREGTDAYYSTVGIQNVQPPEASSPQEAMKMVVEALKSELAAKAEDVQYSDEGPIAYEKKDLSLKAHQFVVSYKEDGRRYKQWTLIVPRPNESVVHLWSYRAPEPQFEVFRPIADAIRQSWRIEVAAAGETVH